MAKYGLVFKYSKDVIELLTKTLGCRDPRFGYAKAISFVGEDNGGKEYTILECTGRFYQYLIAKAMFPKNGILKIWPSEHPNFKVGK